MDKALQSNPLWPSALGALESHFQSWCKAPAFAPDARRWSALARDLSSLGLDKATRDTLIGWAESQAAHRRDDPLKVRLLHPMEREILSVEAYGHLLDLYRVGLLDGPGLEQVLEHCAGLTRLPATHDQVRVLVQRVLSDSIASLGLGSSH